MSYDLHTHSFYSDGELSPEAVITQALEYGVTTLALTDHDTTSGLSAAKNAANRLGMQLICGVEYSATWKNQSIHIVGLNIDPEHPALKQALDSQLNLRLTRAREMADKLAELGIPDVYESILEMAPTQVVGRLHFARFLIENGHVKDHSRAFKQFLAKGKAAYADVAWPDYQEAIEIIQAAGGQAILAHPMRYKLTSGRLRSLLADFAACGDGVEVVTSRQRPHEINYMARACTELDMLASVGSDFHGPGSFGQFGQLAPLPKACIPVWTRWS